MTDAASAMTIVQRLGGSLGSGIFVILLGSTTHPDISAFHLVFACVTGVAALGLAAALLVGSFQQRATIHSPEEHRA